MVWLSWVEKSRSKLLFARKNVVNHGHDLFAVGMRWSLRNPNVRSSCVCFAYELTQSVLILYLAWPRRLVKYHHGQKVNKKTESHV